MVINSFVAIVAAATKVMMIAAANQVVSASGPHGIYNNVSSNRYHIPNNNCLDTKTAPTFGGHTGSHSKRKRQLKHKHYKHKFFRFENKLISITL